MKIFPGNESEKPVLRNIIDDLKQRNNITGRTIQVADKGLNCINNIIYALKNGDGYIFSGSVKTLSDVEKKWVLLENDYVDVKNKASEVLYRIKECVDDFAYTYTDSEGHTKKRLIREKRVVTFNPKLAEKQKYEINRQVEKAKTLKACQAKKSEYGDSAKYVSFIAADKKGQETDGKVKVELNEKAIENAKKLAGYNMMVTSELHMKASQIYNAYHNLWRIEESFRVMKSQLDARPVYLQKEETKSNRNCLLGDASKKVFLCDSEKFNHYSGYRQCSLNDVDYMITETDAKAIPDCLQCYREKFLLN